MEEAMIGGSDLVNELSRSGWNCIVQPVFHFNAERQLRLFVQESGPSSSNRIGDRMIVSADDGQ
jgi:hypothetical protein